MTLTNHQINQRNGPHVETVISSGSAFELTSFSSVGYKSAKLSVYLFFITLASAHCVAICRCHLCFSSTVSHSFRTKPILAHSGVQQDEAPFRIFFLTFFFFLGLECKSKTTVSCDTH